MPENPPPPERIDFPALIDQLSNRLAFADREKLGAFVRGMVVVVLEAVEIRTRKKFNADQVQFCLASSNRSLGATVKLDFIERKDDAGIPKGICSVSIKKSEYSGLPDGVKMGNDPTQTVPMVDRKRVSVVDFKPSAQNMWLSVAHVLKANKRDKAHMLQLDIQIKP